MLNSSSWLFNNNQKFYNGIATQSLRFDGSNSKLTRTPSSSGNQKKWTSSFWVKRSKIGTTQYLWSGGSYSGNNGIAAIYFGSDDKITTYFDTSGANPYGPVNSRLYRDTSAWYHIVWAVDAANTIQKIWVNGVEETLASGNNPPNYDYGMNRSGTLQAFGIAAWGGSPNLNGYLAEITHLDNQYLNETYFGEFKNGVWIAKEYTGSYGTNGFRLQFNQTGTGTASTSTIGADTSGNTNHFTSSGIVASDCDMPDSPENNFCTMNPLHFRASYGMATLSEGNLAYGDAGLSSSWGAQFSTFNLNSGKWYAEVLTKGNSSCSIGVMNVGHYGYQHFLVQNPQNETGNWTLFMDGTDTKSRLNGSLADPTYTAFNNDQVLGIALNADDKELSFYVDGTLQTGLGSSGVIDISTGGSSNDAWSFTANTANGSGVTFVWNFGQDSSFAGDETATSNSDANGNGTFHTALPSSFLALCSANLPEPTISPNADTQADDYFNTVLYTGTGSSGQAITGVGFKPDWLWQKKRSGASSHNVFDSNRGVAKRLYTNGDGAEDEPNQITSFDTDGFTINSGNDSSATYVAWNWKANGGVIATNTAGSITSSVQANTTAGFSIVTYTGNQTNGATIGHGLNDIPQMIIHKNRSVTDDWSVYTKTVGTGKKLFLNDTVAETSTSNYPTTPTNSVFYVGAGVEVNGNGNSMLAYCFHSVESYSKFGSYTGNGSTNGTFVYTGFRPAWVMFKKISATDDWVIIDSTRDIDNVASQTLYANGSFAEDSNVTNRSVDFLSNGFKLRSSGTYINLSSGTFIYMAFAESPFKYSLAR